MNFIIFKTIFVIQNTFILTISYHENPSLFGFIKCFIIFFKQNLLPSTSNYTSTKIINQQQQKFPSPQISPKEIIKDFIESTFATTEIDSGHSSASEHPSPAPPLINSKEEKQQNSSRFSTLSSSCLSSAPSSLSGCSSRNIFDINNSNGF